MILLVTPNWGGKNENEKEGESFTVVLCGKLYLLNFV